MVRRRIIVLGGTLAGPTAAARARELDEDAEITIVQRGGLLSFSFAGLHHHLSGEVPALDDLDKQDATFFRDFYGINALLNTEATALDVENRTLTLKSAAGVQVLAWDAFIFALGAESIAAPGLSGTNVLHLRTFDDVSRLKAIITGGGKRVAKEDTCRHF